MTVAYEYIQYHTSRPGPLRILEHLSRSGGRGGLEHLALRFPTSLSLRSDLSKIYQMPAVPAVLTRFVRKGLPSFGWDPPHKVKR